MKTFLKLLALLSTILFYNCQNTSKIEPLEEKVVSKEVLRSELDTFYLGGKLVKVEKTDKADFDRLPTTVIDTSEIRHLEADADFVKRNGDTLTIKTKAKEVRLITNANDEADNFVNYYYYGYTESIDKFLVYCAYYESYDYMIIDNATGAITNMWGIPVISPDGKYFVTANKDLLAQFTENGIQLYKNGDSPRLIGQRILNKWGSEDIKWSDSKTLVLKASVFDTLAESMERTEYFRLKLEK